MDDESFRRLLEYLNLSWQGYRRVRKGVKKRIRHHMRQQECTGISNYLKLLHSNPVARKTCDLLMTVSISRFFRERLLWLEMEKRLLPELLDRYPSRVRVWSAGCACGEEVYSFKIVWDLLKQQRSQLPELELLATDINPVLLERARLGWYPSSSLKNLPQSIRSSCFKSRKGGRQFKIRAHLKTGIDFRRQDLFNGLPEGRFSLIFLRNNLLTYCRDSIKVPIFNKIMSSLHPQGLLIIGSGEKVPPSGGQLVCDSQFQYIFKSSAGRGPNHDL